jgi:hypothetical protein
VCDAALSFPRERRILFALFATNGGDTAHHLIDGNVLTGEPRAGQAIAGCRSIVAGRERLSGW